MLLTKPLCYYLNLYATEETQTLFEEELSRNFVDSHLLFTSPLHSLISIHLTTIPRMDFDRSFYWNNMTRVPSLLLPSAYLAPRGSERKNVKRKAVCSFVNIKCTESRYMDYSSKSRD